MIAFAMCRAAEASRRKVLGGGGGGSETCIDGRAYEKKRRVVRVYESRTATSDERTNSDDQFNGVLDDWQTDTDT